MVMTGRMLIFGMGYTASRLAARLRATGWDVVGTKRLAGPDAIAFDDEPLVRRVLANASHILSSVPPAAGGGDPVLKLYGNTIVANQAGWVGYLSSTGVYGDTQGAWVDESASIGSGRRTDRAEADLAWQALRPDVRVFRLPGIYGPGRSALDRVEHGKAHRINLPDQVFSRVYVDDIITGVIASFTGPPGVYNLADDLPSSQNDVIEYACGLLGRDAPPLQGIDDAALSPMARGFYAENRRVSNQRAKRVLGWTPNYPDYRYGLDALLHTTEQWPD